MICFALTATAQDYRYKSIYNAKLCKLVYNKKAACNQGTEPFYKFLKKIKSSPSFREQRVKGEFVNLEFMENETFEVYYNKTFGDGYKSSASWTKVSRNKVVFERAFSSAGGYSNSGSTSIVFERINGKWHITECDADC